MACPVAILAGSGQLPLQLVRHLETTGREHRILAFRGFAETPVHRRADAVVDLLDIKGILATLQAWQPTVVTLAGAVSRPGFTALVGAYSLVRNRQEVRDIIARGDDQMLRGAVRILEDHGHTVVGPHELAPDLLVSRDVRGRVAPGADESLGIRTGIDVLGALSSFDIGQAAVVARRRVLAIEGPEGTDRMLHRVRRLGQSWFGGTARREGAVLVKAAKRGQDLRVDMPTVGPRTIVEAARAGLSGIAVGAGSTLLLEQEETLRQADRLGLFVAAVDLPWGGKADD
jgi:DUF1009 family protein